MKANNFSSGPRSSPQTRLYQVYSDGKPGFIDHTGTLRFTLPEDVYTVLPFSEGLAVIAKRVPNSYGRWGFIDETGRVVIDPQFNRAKRFSEGLAAVIIQEAENSGGGLGYIDKTGQIVIQPQFGTGNTDIDFAFSEGLAAVPLRNTDEWGYIDKTGKFVISPKFKYASSFSEGRAWVGIANPDWSIQYKMGMIDREGHWIVEPRFDSAGLFSEGLATIRLGKKLGFINGNGAIVIVPQFDPFGKCPDSNERDASRFSDGLAAVQQDRKWGYIDHSGAFVIKASFDCAQPFSEGLAVIGVRDDKEKRWRFGYIDKTGVIVIEPRFASAGSFTGGLAPVAAGMSQSEAVIKALEAGKTGAEIDKEIERSEMNFGYIDKTGRFVWRP